jgi:EAL domain-containing protein (putative c-di-GMP-specific phosphodiesterase class I)
LGPEPALLAEVLETALARDELHVLYQPIVSLRDGYPIAAEARLRWEHPALGSVSPVRFIPVAERSGEIIAIGLWVLEQACRQLEQWGPSSPSRTAPAAAPAIVEAVIRLAQVLNLTTVAEGVEARDQAAKLQLLGCDTGQGYLFAHPSPAARFADDLSTAGLSTGGLNPADLSAGGLSADGSRSLPRPHAS